MTYRLRSSIFVEYKIDDWGFNRGRHSKLFIKEMKLNEKDDSENFTSNFAGLFS